MEEKEPKLLSIVVEESDPDLEFVFRQLMEYLSTHDERYLVVVEIAESDPDLIRAISSFIKEQFADETSVPIVVVPPYSKVTLVKRECDHVLCRACGQCGKCGKDFKMALHTQNRECVDAFRNAVVHVDEEEDITE